MRIIGNIEHPVLKISVFKADNRISVKFENALYEQTFKLGDDERFSSLEAVQSWVDAALMEEVMAGFRLMHAARLAAMSRRFPNNEQDAFEQII